MLYNVSENKGTKRSDVETPLYACQWLYDIISPHYQPYTILDPAAGDGRLTKPWNAHVLAYELKWGQDFLQATPQDVDMTICNPPFNIGGRKLAPEIFLRKIIEVAGHVPTVLFTPMGLRLNVRRKGRRTEFLRSLNITSIVSLPLDFFEGVLFHSEILFLNMPKLKPHYAL